jgi:hypothetical protein
MQILGGSVDVVGAGQRAAELFLHAGYISAYPRTLWPDMVQVGTPKVELDLVEAFRLQSEQVAHALPTPDMSGFAASVATSGDWWMTALGVAGFFVALVGAYLLRDRLGRAATALPALVLVAALATGFSGLSCSEEELPDKVPWQEVTTKSYADPDMATQGLLHGIIADGIINVGQPIDSLANIQNEVGLPTATPTPGQAYALATYGLDGWGRDFRLTKQDDGQVEVRSAGADGAFDNADDLFITVRQTSNGDWDQSRHAFFLRKLDNEMALFYHRWSGSHFEYHFEDAAQAATGGPLFDYFDEEMMGSLMADEGAPAFDECYAAYATEHEPLVLFVF